MTPINTFIETINRRLIAVCNANTGPYSLYKDSAFWEKNQIISTGQRYSK